MISYFECRRVDNGFHLVVWFTNETRQEYVYESLPKLRKALKEICDSYKESK